GANRVLRLRDVRRDAPADDAADPLESRSGLAVAPDASRVYSLSAGADLRTWETASGRPALNLVEAGKLRAFALSPDGRWIAGSRGFAVLEERLRQGGAGILLQF